MKYIHSKLLLFYLVCHLYYSATLMMHGQTQIKFKPRSNPGIENRKNTFRTHIQVRAEVWNIFSSPCVIDNAFLVIMESPSNPYGKESHAI